MQDLEPLDLTELARSRGCPAVLTEDVIRAERPLAAETRASSFQAVWALLWTLLRTMRSALEHHHEFALLRTWSIGCGSGWARLALRQAQGQRLNLAAPRRLPSFVAAPSLPATSPCT